MIKLLGTLLIVSASSALGFLKSRCLRKRSDSLSGLISSLVLLETEISYGQKSIKDALYSIGVSENMPLFTLISEKIGDLSVSDAFSDTIKRCDMCFSGTDNTIILEFASTLGSLDSSSQVKSIMHTKELLGIAQKEAYEYYKKYGRLYRNMGLLLGILFSLILF